MIRLRHLLVCMFGLFLFSQYVTVAYAQSGNVDWGGWTLDYTIGTQNDGIAINNVRYQGKQVLGKGNFPAMPVYYEGNVCGPYLDRLNGDLVPVEWADNATIVRREFTVDGEQWYELGIREFIGNYDIYQVWYFNSEGILDAHLFSRGLQCNIFHEHWPHWRFDFDVAGSANDQILRRTGSGLEAYTTEFNVEATAAQDHDWIVQDTVTGDYVEIQFDSGEWNVAGTVVAETMYAKNRVVGRAYNSGEESWHTAGHASLPADWDDGVDRVGYGNDEPIDDTDIVLWYSGYLPHSASEGSNLWHSTGVRLIVKDSSSPAPTNTPAPTDTPTPTQLPTNTPTPTAPPLPTNTPVPTTPPMQGACTTYTSGDTPISMPNNVSDINSIINVPDGGTVTDVNVSVDMPHEWVGDLIFSLEHDGTNVTIIDQPGVPASNFGCRGRDIVATLDDSASTAVESVCAISAPTLNGTFSPNNALSAFDGADRSGDWTLLVEDTYISADEGTLNSWSVEICTADTPPDPPTATPVSPSEPSIIWQETFDELSNGTDQDGGDTAWSSAGSLNFGVTAGRFGTDGYTAGEVIWVSEPISIEGYDVVSLSADIFSDGVLETSGVYQDYLRLYYKIDGGNELLIAENLGGFDDTTVSLSDLSGSTIEIVIRAKTTGGSESYSWDNVTISGS